MKRSFKYRTLMARMIEGRTLWEACKMPGTPSYRAARNKFRINADGIRQDFIEALGYDPTPQPPPAVG